jgi:hypothetical protein
MSTEPIKPESDRYVSKDDEVVPEGTFAGTQKKPVEVKEGEPVPDDTGDQGAGQN